MDLTRIPLLSGLAQRLDFLAARTGVIAENIANADTPNYAARDIEKPNFGAMAERAAMRVSDPRHIAGPQASAGGDYRAVSAPDGEASLTGNQVSLETQAMKLSQTRSDYTLAATVYRKGLAMLRLAARGQ
jgi:flagellar basal-body rod protein FlgB